MENHFIVSANSFVDQSAYLEKHPEAADIFRSVMEDNNALTVLYFREGSDRFYFLVKTEQEGVLSENILENTECMVVVSDNEQDKVSQYIGSYEVSGALHFYKSACEILKELEEELLDKRVQEYRPEIAFGRLDQIVLELQSVVARYAHRYVVEIQSDHRHRRSGDKVKLVTVEVHDRHTAESVKKTFRVN